MEDEGLGTHLWVGNYSRRLEVDDNPLVLFRCPLCERDFARAPADSNWRAVRVSTFRVDYLSDSISQQWTSESCPGTSSEKLPVNFVQHQSETDPVTAPEKSRRKSTRPLVIRRRVL
jgi:hypothetical protein